MKKPASSHHEAKQAHARRETRLAALLKELDVPQQSDAYFDNFLVRFREHQRSDLLQRSSLTLFWERLQTIMDNLTTGRWLLAGGTAYASILLALALFINTHSPPGDDQMLAPAAAGEKSAGDGEYYIHLRIHEQRILPLPASQANEPVLESADGQAATE